MRSARKDRHWAAALGYAVGRSARWAWDRRLELSIFAATFALYWIATTLPWFIYAPVTLVLGGGAVYDASHGFRVARLVGRGLSGARLRRRVERAASGCGLHGLRVESVRPTLPGEMVEVRVARGQTVDKLEGAARTLAGDLRVADVRVIADRDDRSRALMSIIRRDPFASMSGAPWPLLDAESVSIRDGIPFGQDEYGRVVNARLLSRNIILGGAPDSGKSAALRLFAAAALLDPRVKLWMMDAKPEAVEFSVWATAAHKLVRGRDLQSACGVLAQLEERVWDRYRDMTARGEVFVGEDSELDVLMIDELPQYMRSFETDSKDQVAAVKTIRGGIWKLISMGRAAGMITILSAQKPTADIIPSESRDLIDHKFALHCNTRAMSDAILGAGAGEESPANAADIPAGQPGVGYYVGDDGVRKMRAFFVSHRQALELASRVAARRIDSELEEMAQG